jgi:hypothetical protein
MISEAFKVISLMESDYSFLDKYLLKSSEAS